ncbi:MAG: hypothetical protein QOG01_4357, partial [Pseudonocardiales bacterium]|nr:hypothetical protein [Pseudonocardiales bacterium]
RRLRPRPPPRARPRRAHRSRQPRPRLPPRPRPQDHPRLAPDPPQPAHLRLDQPTRATPPGPHSRRRATTTATPTQTTRTRHHPPEPEQRLRRRRRHVTPADLQASHPTRATTDPTTDRSRTSPRARPDRHRPATVLIISAGPDCSPTTQRRRSWRPAATPSAVRNAARPNPGRRGPAAGRPPGTGSGTVPRPYAGLPRPVIHPDRTNRPTAATQTPEQVPCSAYPSPNTVGPRRTHGRRH